MFNNQNGGRQALPRSQPFAAGRCPVEHAVGEPPLSAAAGVHAPRPGEAALIQDQAMKHVRPQFVAAQLLTLREVLGLTGMCRSTLYNKLNAGEFVKPIRIGARSIRFLEAEVLAWVTARVDQRNAGEARHGY